MPMPPHTRPLLFTLLGLLVLTGLSYLVTHLGFERGAVPVALAIAAAKAMLVAWMFMEIMHASLPARVVALVTISFIALLCVGTVADIDLR
jgi:caa(3)-type oxidase subunit IV